MRFQHRMFNIECSATLGGDGFIGQAIIWRMPADAEPEGAFRSGDLSSFPTHSQAIGFARFWANPATYFEFPPEMSYKQAPNISRASRASPTSATFAPNW